MYHQKSSKYFFLAQYRYFLNIIFPPYTSRRYYFHKFMILFFKYSIEDGDVIQGENQTKVYLIQHGQKHHIRRIKMFEKLGYTSNDIEFVTREILNKIPTGAPI
jgi:hypothetical protein